jgi:uncharacterized protein (DUF305 family)
MAEGAMKRAICVLLIVAGVARAQDSTPPGHVLAPAFVPGGPAVDADRDAVKTMLDALHSPPQGDADRDFASRLIPMDQAAIDLAEMALKYGNDAKVKQMAARIIASRQHEIAFLQAWQDKHPARLPAIDPHIQYK